MTPSSPLPHASSSASKNHGRLLRRTFWGAFLLVSGGLLSSSTLELVWRFHESVASLRALQQSMADKAAGQVQRFLDDLTHTLQVTAHAPMLTTEGLTAAYRFHLHTLLRAAPAMMTATALDTTGRESVKVSRLAMVLADDLGERAGEEAFRQAMTGQVFVGPVFFVRESEPYVCIAVPLVGEAERIVGVLLAEVTLTAIWDVIRPLSIGTTGYAYVVTQDGTLIAHPDLSLVLQKRNVTHLGQVQAALRGLPTPVRQRNLQGQWVFPTYAPIPPVGWIVMVERLSAEAYAPLYASLGRTGALFLLGIALAAVASAVIRRRVVLPLAVLRQGAFALGAGALEHRITLQTGNELQDLADTFNQMATQLQASHTTLETQVAARTRELARSVAELHALNAVGQAVSASLDLPTVLQTVITHAVSLAQAQGGALYEYDEATRTWVLQATAGTDAPLSEALQAAAQAVGEETVGQALVSQAPVHIPDMAALPATHLPQTRRVLATAAHRALLMVPLLLEQHVLGGLVVWRHEVGHVPEELVSLLQTFAAQSSLAIQNARLFRTVETQRQALEIANQHKSQFLATMTHELRTPLTAILGYTELLMEHGAGAVASQTPEILGQVHRSAQHLLTLINAVLDLTRLKAGHLVLTLEEYSMREVMLGAQAALAPLAAAKQLQLQVTMPAHLPLGRGDGYWLLQVLLNLGSNAITFTEQGEVGISVEASAETFTLRVWDTGPGIAPADQQRIFEEFQQGDNTPTRRHGGAGLGLAIAKRLIELHGGQIGVTSQPGAGATFWCTLPIRVSASQQGC